MPSDPILPDANKWRNHAALAQVRANQLELKYGANDAGTSGAISLVQQTLVFWGKKIKKPAVNFLTKYGADGKFGSETKDALVAFQKANKDVNGETLQPDGILGDLTLGVLDTLFKQTPDKPVPPPPPPKKEDDGKLIEIFVDFVYFNDGPEKWRLNKAFPVANEVFNRMNIKVSPGDRILPGGKGTKAVDSNVLANNAFDINRDKSGKRIPGAHQSVLSSITAMGEVKSTEFQRLTLFNRKDRITAFFVASFPEGPAQGKAGVTYCPAAHKAPPTIFISKTYIAVDSFWHELGHALLNTTLAEDDHAFDTFMWKEVDEKLRTATILPEQEAAMRATARSLR